MQESLNDLAKGYIDGVTAPVVAGAEYAVAKGLSSAGIPYAQSVVANMENQIVIGFGKSTTKTGIVNLSTTLSDLTASSYNNGGGGFVVDKNA